MKGTDANKSKRIKPDKMAKTARKKKVTKAKRGIEEFYRKKKVGDKLKYAFGTVIVTFMFAMLMAFIAIILMNADTKTPITKSNNKSTAISQFVSLSITATR